MILHSHTCIIIIIQSLNLISHPDTKLIVYSVKFSICFLKLDMWSLVSLMITNIINWQTQDLQVRGSKLIALCTPRNFAHSYIHCQSNTLGVLTKLMTYLPTIPVFRYYTGKLPLLPAYQGFFRYTSFSEYRWEFLQ